MPRGGARKGAGRPKGTGKFGERTVPIRVPSSMVVDVTEFIEAKGYSVPLFSYKVAAGDPVWADDYIANHIFLSPQMMRNEEDTFCVQVDGESMLNAGIDPDDILVVDKSLPAEHGKIVIAAVNGELTVKRLQKRGRKLTLMPENKAYQPIVIGEGTDFHIWGIVTNIIKKVN